MQLMVFSKHLAGPPLEETARRLRAMNIGAIDLTVREGGHVEPSQVEDALPQAAKVLSDNGVRIGMMTTNITDADDPLTAKVLSTAAKLGIEYYKLGYYPYQGFGTLKQQRADVKAKVRDLAQLNREYNMRGGFHNHSANSFGASLWDVHHVLEDVAPEAMGLYLDPAHATVEGNAKCWMMGMDLLQERIIMLAVKDFRWIEGDDNYSGGRANRAQWLPLENGNVRWNQVLSILKQINFNGPVSLHSEYQGGHSWRDLTTDEVFEQTARDAKVFRGWMRDADLQEA